MVVGLGIAVILLMASLGANLVFFLRRKDFEAKITQKLAELEKAKDTAAKTPTYDCQALLKDLATKQSTTIQISRVNTDHMFLWSPKDHP